MVSRQPARPYDAADRPRPPVTSCTRGGTVTRILGTEFAIQAYPGSSTEVVVRSGRVELRPTSGPDEAAQLLEGGDRGEVGADGRVVVESGVDVDALLAWTEGTLAFLGAPLQQVIPKLERWFDLSVRLEDPSLGPRRLTATFTDEPLDLVLSTRAELVGASAQRDGRQVVFSPVQTR